MSTRTEHIKVLRYLLRVGLPCVLSSLAGLCAQTVDGLGYISTHQGQLFLKSAEGKISQPAFRDCVRLHNTVLSTPEKSEAIVSLSNNMAIGLSGESSLEIVQFQQSPFSEEDASIRYEPSTSILELRPTNGTIDLAAEQQAPLSEFKLILPVGYVLFKNVQVRIQIAGAETKLAILNGTMTFFSNQRTRPIYLTGPTHLTLSKETLSMEVLPEQAIESVLTDSDRRFTTAVAQAPYRVFFQSLEKGQIVQPKPIVDTDYYDQPVTRPYEIKESP